MTNKPNDGGAADKKPKPKKPRDWSSSSSLAFCNGSNVSGERWVATRIASALSAREAESLAEWLVKAAAWAREKEKSK